MRSSRSRLLPAVLVLLASGGLLPAPAAAADPGSASALRGEVARLRAEVEQVATELAAGAVAVDRAVQEHARLVQEQSRLGALEQDGQQAARATRRQAGELARRAYTGQALPQLSLLLTHDLRAVGDLAYVRETLARAGTAQGRRIDALARADAATRASLGAVEQGRELALARREALGRQLEALDVRARRASARLQATSSRLEQRLAADRLATATRQQREAAARAAAAAASTGQAGGCGAPSPYGAVNGFLSPDELCPLQSAAGHRLRSDAAAAFDRLSAARRAETGAPLCLTDSYRDYAGQVDVFARKPSLAAVPGRSRHGLGLAVDLCGGAERFGTETDAWLRANAPRYGCARRRGTGSTSAQAERRPTGRGAATLVRVRGTRLAAPAFTGERVTARRAGRWGKVTSTLEAPVRPLPPEDRPAPERLLRSPSVVLALLAVVAGLVSSVLLLLPQPPGEDSAEVGFARDMSRHHAQAVQMSEVLRDRTSDPALLALTSDIALTQQGQIGLMSGWLTTWGVSQSTSGPSMAWMGTPTEGLMPGMATAADLASLRTLPVAEAEGRYLELMVAHHAGGVEMAQAGSSSSDDPQVVALAESIVRSQTAEIAVFQDLRAARGLPAAPVPDAMAMAIDQGATPGHDASGGHSTAGPALREALLLVAVTVGVLALLWLLLDTTVRQAGIRLPGRGRLVALTSVAATVAAAVHVVLTPAHAEESVAYGLFFAASAAVLLLGTALLLAGLQRAGALVLLLPSAGLVVLWTLFRVVAPPGAEGPEGVDAYGLVSVAAELVVVACGLALLRPATRRTAGSLQPAG